MFVSKRRRDYYSTFNRISSTIVHNVSNINASKVRISPDGKHTVVGFLKGYSNGANLKLYESDTLTLLKEIDLGITTNARYYEEIKDEINLDCVEYSPDGRLIVVASENTIQFLDASTLELKKILINPHGVQSIDQVFFSLNQKYVISQGLFDPRAKVWNLDALMQKNTRGLEFELTVDPEDYYKFTGRIIELDDDLLRTPSIMHNSGNLVKGGGINGSHILSSCGRYMAMVDLHGNMRVHHLSPNSNCRPPWGKASPDWTFSLHWDDKNNITLYKIDDAAYTIVNPGWILCGTISNPHEGYDADDLIIKDVDFFPDGNSFVTCSSSRKFECDDYSDSDKPNIIQVWQIEDSSAILHNSHKKSRR